ncbi:MAG: hypothetical protein M3Y08_01265 [Fibrobacterota bacterium]|nr:hypothetical protein [Fibrobacterota bacterium]
MTHYNPAITAHKTAVIGGFGTVGVIIEIVVDKTWPGLFPNGVVTAAVVTVFSSFQNWFKNK